MYQKFLLGCKALIKNDEGNYLMLGQNSLRDTGGVDRMLPGGRIEVGEVVYDVLGREVEEETGYMLLEDQINYLGMFQTTIILTVDGSDYGLILSYYECVIVENKEPVLSNEHEQYKRVAKEEIYDSLVDIVENTEMLAFLK